MAKIVITAPHIVKNDGRLLRQYASLKKFNHEVKFLAPMEISANNEMVEYIEWPHRAIASLCRFFPPALQRLVSHRLRNYYWSRALRKQNADIIIASEPEGLIAALPAQNERTKIIYDCHEFHDDETEDLGRNLWAQKTHKKLIDRADAVLTVSQGILDLYLGKFPNIRNPSIQMNTSPFEKCEYDGRVHEICGIGRDKKIIMFHGNLRASRGIEGFPKIAASLDDDCVFVIVGDGEMAQFLKNHQNDKLKIISQVPYYEVPKYLMAANLGLILYVPHNLNQDWCAPNKLFELTNLGIPILAFKARSMVEFAKQLPNLHLIESSSNEEQIAQNINAIIKTKISAAPIPKEFSQHYQEQNFINLINKLLSN